MRKWLVVFLILLIPSNCAETQLKVSYEPSPSEGCSAMTDVRARLTCISKLIKTLEDIRNAEIVVTSKKEDRIDWEYVKVKDTYCYVSKVSKDNLMCFESFRKEYDPTFLGRVYTIATKVGFGFLIGVVAGLHLAG